MWEIYWLTRLDGIREFFNGLSILFTIASILTSIAWLVLFLVQITEGAKELEPYVKKTRNWFFGLVTVCVLSYVPNTLLPTTKEACLIYVGGSVIDYVQGSEKLRELPDDIVSIAGDYVDILKVKSEATLEEVKQEKQKKQ